MVASRVRTQPHCTWNRHESSLIEGITWPTSSSRRSVSAWPPSSGCATGTPSRRLKTLFKQLENEVAEGQTEEAAKTATFLTSRIDKAAAKGVLHKNNAAHKKSRVAHTLARLSS